MTAYVGDLIAPKDKEHYILVSGCNSYTHAVVTSVDPFIIVSEEGDMLWRHMDPKEFDYVGAADANALMTCITRMNKDLRRDEIIEHNANLTKELFEHAHDSVSRNDLEGFSRAVEILISKRESTT